MPPKAVLCAFGGLLIVKFILHRRRLNDLRGGGPLAVVGIKIYKAEIPHRPKVRKNRQYFFAERSIMEMIL